MSRLNRTDRPYDIVLFGATGFVGALTAEYLAAHAPEGLRWAIAGRDELKLKRLRERLPRGTAVGVLRADVSDPSSLRELAEHARVVATTVGPYVTYGEDLVAACADTGTDYLDLSGEPEFVDLTYVRHDARARETGARLVHCAGFDSIPHDLGAYFTVQQLPEGVPLTVDGFVTADAMFSGGTFASALTQFARGRQVMAAAWGGAATSRAWWAAGPKRPWGHRGSPGRSTPGRCPCRPSTRRSFNDPRRPWPATAPTSATATTRPHGTSRWRSAGSRPPAPCSRRPNSRPPGAGCRTA